MTILWIIFTILLVLTLVILFFDVKNYDVEDKTWDIAGYILIVCWVILITYCAISYHKEYRKEYIINCQIPNTNNYDLFSGGFGGGSFGGGGAGSKW